MADPTNEPNRQQEQEPDGGQQQAQGQQQQQQAPQGQQQEPDGGKAKGIDPHKYQRDIEKRDQRIAELEGQIAEAAKTVLADYDGDVAKLKEGAPYLFGQERKGATDMTG